MFPKSYCCLKLNVGDTLSANECNSKNVSELDFPKKQDYIVLVHLIRRTVYSVNPLHHS